MRIRRSNTLSSIFSAELSKIASPDNKENKDYRIQHRPMKIESGSSWIYDLTPSFGEDIYGPNAIQFFGSGDPREAKIIRLLKSIRGNQNAQVTIYRGVPIEAPDEINSGDWVTLDKSVAQQHADLLKSGKVISKTVPASHVTGWADSLLEFGYFPS